MDVLSSLGFMFDAARNKSTSLLQFQGGYVINLRQIDDLPGHIQSGVPPKAFVELHVDFLEFERSISMACRKIVM